MLDNSDGETDEADEQSSKSKRKIKVKKFLCFETTLSVSTLFKNALGFRTVIFVSLCSYEEYNTS